MIRLKVFCIESGKGGDILVHLARPNKSVEEPPGWDGTPVIVEAKVFMSTEDEPTLGEYYKVEVTKDRG